MFQCYKDGQLWVQGWEPAPDSGVVWFSIPTRFAPVAKVPQQSPADVAAACREVFGV